jgi:BTB/POZ domain-containing protein 7
MLFLREEFVHLMNAPSFLDLSRTTLSELVQSDFLQASEVDVLTAIVRWGESQLIKRVEDRAQVHCVQVQVKKEHVMMVPAGFCDSTLSLKKPNLLTTTRDSVTRKGIKRRDLSDVELREIIGDIIFHVRIEHILNADVLAHHVRRGLISLPPSNLMLADKYNPWLTTRPRLYTPFYEEARSILRSTCGTEVTTRRGNLRLFIPDTLYMVDEHQQSQQQVFDDQQMVIDPEVLTAMKYREAKLRAANSRALTVSREAISKYIRLRVVREFGFPDTVTSLLDDKIHVTQPTLVDPPKDPPVTQQPLPQQQQPQEQMMPDICGATDSPKFNEELLLDLGDDKFSSSLGRNRPRQKNMQRDQRVYSTLRYASITPPPPHYL